jgi:hypothetical protein
MKEEVNLANVEHWDYLCRTGEMQKRKKCYTCGKNIKSATQSGTLCNCCYEQYEDCYEDVDDGKALREECEKR